MNCKNCSTVLHPQNNYCFTCGAQVIRNRLTIKNLFSHFIETFFSYDNKFLQTLVYLFKNPKDVIDSYVNGVRKKYIAPLALFAIAITLSGIYLFILKKYFPFIFEMADSYHSNDISREIGNTINQFTTEYNSLLFFALIPLLAFISRIVFLKNKYNFTEHLIIYFYTMSLFSLFSIVTNLILLKFFAELLIPFIGILYFLFFLYHSYLLKQVFDLSIKQLLVKIMLFLPLFFFVFIAGSILVFILVFITGDYSLQDLAPQP